MAIQLDEKQQLFLERVKITKREYDKAERAWSRCIIDSMRFGVDIENAMKAELSDMDFEKEKEFVSTMKVSEYLTGKRRNLMHHKVPDKHKYPYFLLLYKVKNWLSILETPGIKVDKFIDYGKK